MEHPVYASYGANLDIAYGCGNNELVKPFIYVEGFNPEFFENVISGFVVFNQFTDRQGDQNGIVSGSFEFTVKNEELDSTVVVTDGRFQYVIDYQWY